MSKESTQRNAVRTAVGLGLGAALATLFPPAGIAVAVGTVLRSARKYAQSGDVRDAQGMVTGYSDASNLIDRK